MEDSLILQLSGCSPSTPSPQPRNTCRLVPLLGTPAKAPDFVHLNGSFQKAATSSVLHGIVAYVDVRSESDNRSRAVGYELEQLGATVVDRFTDDVTHFVYKDGKKRTLDMAIRRKVHLVSVLWVESCKQNQRKVPEDEFRITLPKKQTPIGPVKFKRYKSMQPKSFDEEVVLSEEKLLRKQQRKDKVVTFQMTHTPEANRLQNFFVAETCRRSPTTNELVSPMSICVPDTPPSMRRHLAKSQSARRGSCAVQSPRSSLSLNPVQRKFSFDEDDSSPEVISVSSGSHPLSHSSQDDSHPSITAPAQKVVSGSQKTSDGAGGSVVQSACGINPALTESISPEIELQTTKPFPHFMNSSSSLESEKKEIDSKWMSNIAELKLKNDDFKSSPAKPEFETPSRQVLMSSFVRRRTLGLPSTNIKRKHSPSLEEETAFSTKRSRSDENSSTYHQSKKVPSVSLIPLSQLKSETPQSPPVGIKKRIGLEHRNRDATQNSHLHLNSDNLSASDCSKQNDASPIIQLQSLKSFIHSSPTSSQEASRSCNNGTLLSSRDLPAESHTRNIEQHLTEITPAMNGFHHAKFEQQCATPCIRPLTCADSLVLETRIQKRRSLVPFNSVLKSNGKLISCRKTLTSGEPDLDIACNDSSTNSISPSKVILQRLPGAWDKSRSSNSSNSTSIERKVLSENAVIQQDARSKLDSIKTMASPSAKKTKRDGTNVGLSPVRKSSDTNQGTNPTEKEKRNNDKRLARKVGKQKMKTSSSTSSTSSTESVARFSLPSIVITSLHRDEQKMVNDVVQKLGSYVLNEEVNEQTTHMVAGGNRRTVKLLAGISRGLWILSLDWVRNSAKKGKWLPEEQFELTNFFPAAKMSRLERERLGPDYRHDLFSKVGDIFVADGSAPPKKDLEHLITVCQGKVTKQLRTAKVCVGKFLRQSITNISEKWILDCITQHECLPTTDYVLNA